MTLTDHPVEVFTANQIGYLTLNRPASLNALTLPMIQALHRQLTTWEQDPAILAVVMQGAGDRAFCAGGDVRALYDSYKEGGDLHTRFFSEEYALDQYLHHYPKPVLAILDGITLGGGMGLTQGADFRLVTERSRLGMPEVGIGFFPDVGASYFLPRLKDNLGTYLGISGNQVKAADALYCGLANCYLESARLAELRAALGELRWTDKPHEDLAGMLDKLARKTPTDAPLAQVEPAINEHFAHDRVSAIRAALATETRPQYQQWAQELVTILDSRSPIAMEVTLRALRRGRELALDECFAQEGQLVQKWMEHGDFIEGVRALIVDKDNSPRWSPPTLGAVSEERIAHFF